MLLQKISCPMGCANAILLEHKKIINIGTSNLLLDNQNTLTPQITEVIKVYTCQCCGNRFEMHDKKSDNRIVL